MIDGTLDPETREILVGLGCWEKCRWCPACAYPPHSVIHCNRGKTKGHCERCGHNSCDDAMAYTERLLQRRATRP